MRFHFTSLAVALCILSIPILNAQNHIGDYAVKPPDVNAFETINFVEANEYSGKIAISVPIFSFSIDGVTIPISIDYNSRGILVNESSSRVGMGWSLQAGGMISKSVKGFDDFELSSDIGESGGSTSDATLFTSAMGSSVLDVSGNITAVYTRMGSLMYCDPSICTYEVNALGREREPDIYNVRVSGLNTSFTHKRVGPVITPV
ncbi:MAG: hypothetical protein L3J09_07065 [Flavobacteriaceae bacterium]|nr:hypothetical protein [Flavobacteriaceae bacterium]